MPKPRPLSPGEATNSFANRFSRVADNARQIATNLGLRPYRVFLIWTKWTGEERGEGDETEFRRIEILPTPKVNSLDNVTFGLFHAGTVPMGSLRVDRISATFTQDTLQGRIIPVPGEDTIPDPYGFFYEVVEDGRGDNPPQRAKFRLLNTPFRRAGKIDWTIMLERISADREREKLVGGPAVDACGNLKLPAPGCGDCGTCGDCVEDS